MSKKLIPNNMKKFLSVMLILTLCFYASGCVILARSGYKLKDCISEAKSTSDFLYHYFNNAFSKLISSYSSHSYTVNDNISEINLNLTSQNIQVVNSSDSMLNIKIEGLFSSDLSLDLIDNDNKMTFLSNVDIPEFINIILEMPTSISNKITLKITTKNGNININNFSCNSISLSTANGDLLLEHSNFNYIYSSSSCGDITLNYIFSSKETNISNMSGSIYGSGRFGIFTANTTSGDINFAFTSDLNNMFLSSISGDINLCLPSNSGYEVNFDTLSGTLNAEKDTLFNTDRYAKINVHTNNSDLNVQKN